MTTNTFSDLRSARLILRRLLASDAPALVDYRSRPEVARFQSWATFDVEAAETLIAGQAGLEPDEPGTWFQVAIVEARSDLVVGDCGLHFLSDDPRQVEIGVTLHPDYQNQGIAREAIACLLDYLFGALDKHRVIATTDAENLSAARLFETLGFRREAHFIENIWFKGAYGSEYLFALLSREWTAEGCSGC